MVGVQCGSGWGSGVIVSKTPGVIITCAHVIGPANSDVSTFFFRGRGQCFRRTIMYLCKGGM